MRIAEIRIELAQRCFPFGAGWICAHSLQLATNVAERDAFNTLLNQAKSRAQTGVGPRSDVDQAQAFYDATEQPVIDARNALEKALAINGADAEANYSLGMVFAQTGNTERASEYLHKALELRPAYPEALNNLGILYLRTQRPQEAVASFEECIRTSPDFDQSYLNLAQVYALENQPAKARETLLELLGRHPENAQAKKVLEQISH